MVISKKKKKKRSSPKFGLLFLAVPHHHLSKFPDFAQIFHIAARKILILPKSSKLGGAIAPPAPPAGTAMILLVRACVSIPNKCRTKTKIDARNPGKDHKNLHGLKKKNESSFQTSKDFFVFT